MKRIVSILAIVAAATAPAWAQEVSDDEAKEHVKAFKKEIGKAKEPSDQVIAIEGLGSKQHAKILDELKSWLGKGSVDVRIAAAEQIGKYKGEEKAAEALLGAAKSTNARKDTMDVAIKCIRYLANTGVRKMTKSLVAFFGHRDNDFAREVVDTCGALKSKDAIDPLINLVRELEAIKEEDTSGSSVPGGIPGGMPGGGPAPNQQDEKIERKKALLNPAIQALKDITGEKYNTGQEWTKWWSKNKNSFKEQEAPEEKK